MAVILFLLIASKSFSFHNFSHTVPRLLRINQSETWEVWKCARENVQIFFIMHPEYTVETFTWITSRKSSGICNFCFHRKKRRVKISYRVFHSIIGCTYILHFCQQDFKFRLSADPQDSRRFLSTPRIHRFRVCSNSGLRSFSLPRSSSEFKLYQRSMLGWTSFFDHQILSIRSLRFVPHNKKMISAKTRVDRTTRNGGTNCSKIWNLNNTVLLISLLISKINLSYHVQRNYYLTNRYCVLVAW